MEKELEQFYKVFEIEPKEKRWCPLLNKLCIDCKTKPCKIKRYPPITDTIILELINIILKTGGEFRIIGAFSDITILRKNIIQACNSIAPQIKPQVQELFKELK